MLSGLSVEGVAMDGICLGIADVSVHSEGSTDGGVAITAGGVATGAGMAGGATS